MRIGIDIRSLMDKEYSGVSWYTLDLIKHIIEEDDKNEYIFYYNSYQNIKNRLPNFKKGRVVSTHYPNKIFNYILQKIFSFPKLDKLLGVDIFFSPHTNFTSLSKKAKSVLTVHDLSFLRYPEFFSSRKNFWHRMLNTKKMLKRADKVVAVSDNTAKDIEELVEIPPQKIEVVYPGLNDKFKKLDKGDPVLMKTREKYDLPGKFALFLSTIEPRKNVVGVLRAFDRCLDMPEMSGYILVVAGGSGWKNKNVTKVYNELKHKDRIRFIGYLKEEEKVYFYNLASMFIYPSFYEGFGFPPLEAMACGTPVIVGANSSLVESTGEAGILVDPENVESIAQAIRQLASDPNLRRRLTEKGFVQASKFDWRDTARKYLRIFESLA